MLYAQLACALGLELGLVSSLQEEYELHLSLQAGRFSLIEHNNATIIDSSYNAAPASMQQVLKNAFHIREQLYPESRILLIL